MAGAAGASTRQGRGSAPAPLPNRHACGNHLGALDAYLPPRERAAPCLCLGSLSSEFNFARELLQDE